MSVGRRTLACSSGLLLVFLLLSQAAAATTHFVDVGASAEFFDRDTGTFSSFFGPPVSTFVAVGDTVVWQFHSFQHSTTSGPCFANGFTCVADGLWDSGVQNDGFVFSRTFDTPGTFSYFCKNHGFFSGQGQIIVLSQPDFGMRIGDQFSNGTTLSGWAGTTVAFTGTLFSRAGFNNPVTLSCANGAPRLPSRCPGGPVTISPSLGGTAFIFPVADDSPGAFNLDIVGRGTDSLQTTHSQRVTLNLIDYSVNLTSPSSVVVFTQGASFPITYRVTADSRSPFGIAVTFRCTGMPADVSCLILRDGTIFNEFFAIFLNPGVPEDFSLVLLAGASAQPGTHSGKLEVRSTSVFNSTTAAVRSRSFSVLVIGPMTHFDFDPPNPATPGTALPVMVRARDTADNVVINYGGTVRFSSSDPADILPPDYTFVTAPVPENGTHTFPLTFNTIGPRSVTITDLATGIKATKLIFVGNLNANNTVSLSAGGEHAFFRHGSVTFNVVVSGAGPSPTGLVRFFDGLRNLGTAVLSPAGVGMASASFTTQSLAPGGHSVIAVYEGDANYGANFSTAVSKPRSPAPRCVNNVCPGSH